MNTIFKETIDKVLSSKKTHNLIFMNGKYHDVEMYEHIQAIQKVANPEFYSFIQELWEDVNAAEESCNALADMGEHPEWHHYKIARDTVEFNIMERFYKEGGCRLNIQFIQKRSKGTYHKPVGNVIAEHINLYADGHGYGLANIAHDLKEAQDMYNFENVRIQNLEKR